VLGATSGPCLGDKGMGSANRNNPTDRLPHGCLYLSLLSCRGVLAAGGQHRQPGHRLVARARAANVCRNPHSLTVMERVAKTKCGQVEARSHRVRRGTFLTLPPSCQGNDLLLRAAGRAKGPYITDLIRARHSRCIITVLITLHEFLLPALGSLLGTVSTVKSP
jgi:hypothetical protein